MFLEKFVTECKNYALVLHLKDKFGFLYC